MIMRRDRWHVVAMLLVVLWAVVVAAGALAQGLGPVSAAGSVEDPSVLLSALMQAVQGGRWGVVVGLALMIVVAIAGKTSSMWRKNEDLVPYLPHLTLLLAVAGAVGTALVSGTGAGGATIAVAGAVSIWWTAMGAWETVGKGARWLLSKVRKDGQAAQRKDIKAVITAVTKTGSLDLSAIRGLGIRMYDGKDPQ